MDNPRDLDGIRADLEERQHNVLWEDARRGGRSVDAFLWKGDPNAKPVQRAGLIVFAMGFLFMSLAAASIPFAKHFDEGWPIDFVMAAGALAISGRLFQNAFRRGPKHAGENAKDEHR